MQKDTNKMDLHVEFTPANAFSQHGTHLYHSSYKQLLLENPHYSHTLVMKTQVEVMHV